MITKGIVYTQLPSGVHRLVFHDVQAATMQDFMNHLKRLLDVTPSDQVIRLLLYLPAVPSIQYLLGYVREIKELYPQRAPARIAVIYSASLQLSLLGLVTRALVRASTLRLFPKGEEEQALVWVIK